MDIRRALLFVLATVPTTGCSSVWNCNPPEQPFDIDEVLSAEQLDEIVADYGLPNRDSIACETACAVVYHRIDTWEIQSFTSCELSLPEDPDGQGRVTCAGQGIEYYCEGRRPLGHVEGGDPDCDSALGRSLAAMAYLEAASIDAFAELATSLEARDAPAPLVDRCRAAADDERHHTRWLTALAEAHGAAVPAPAARPSTQAATLLDLAEHNAREGCVHETFAALMAHHRARHAPDRRLRQVFARIAADETRHAQLAWDLDAWLRAQLARDEARQVEAARREALAALPDRAWALASLPAELGPLPGPEAEALAAGLAAQLAA